MSARKSSRSGGRHGGVPTGIELLQDPRWNKGTAFTEAERHALHIQGLLPPRIFTQEEQERRVLGNFRRKTSDLEKYIFMISLQDRNEALFYRTVMNHIDEMLPIIYTPTVGEASRHFGQIFRRPRGLYVTAADRGRIADVLRNWHEDRVAIAVVTDGQRILGLGDLGAYGMGIPIGKLSLYTALAGIDPSLALPVMLDVGTDNEALLQDPLYTGLLQRRLRGERYDEFVEEFVASMQEVFPGALIQFEDFATNNAIRLLATYRDRICTFNDDIQGTAAVTLGGLYSATRLTGRPLHDQVILFFGAGSAAVGIADLIVGAMVRDGLSEPEARRRCWFMDSRGLVVASRTDLAAHKRPYAHDHAPVAGLAAAVETLRPTALIGVSGQAQTFTESVLRTIAAINERPIVFALSNPTANSECTAEQAYRWTDGRAVFASGSPFAAVRHEGKTLTPGQGNNAYIFPGLGLGIIAAKTRRETDEMFHLAARTLATHVTDESLRRGSVYPPLAAIREVSAAIASAVVREARDRGLAMTPLPPDIEAHVRSHMWVPSYVSYV